jgi:hypothetical protein
MPFRVVVEASHDDDDDCDNEGLALSAVQP